MRPIILCLVTAAFASACAAHRSVSLSDRFVHQGEPAMRLTSQATGTPADDPLSVFIEKVRHLSLAARPASSQSVPSVEASDKELEAALRQEIERPGAQSFRAVGEVYRRLGVLDLAYERFNRAVKVDASDAVSYDQLARIWRDWGFPNLGLGDAYRAIHYAPDSPAAYNTLGTLLQALGQYGSAQRAYARAIALDRNAAYAFSNLCSALIEEGRPGDAIAPCERAVALQPSLVTAQRNLAIAHDRLAPDQGLNRGRGEGSAPPAPGIPATVDDERR